MQRESRVRKSPNYDAICFHAQQCAEKYLKARLTEADIEFGKVHDLVALLDLVLAKQPDWSVLSEDLAYLSDFTVSYRYPGDSADKASALDAVQRCHLFRKIARSSFGLPK